MCARPGLWEPWRVTARAIRPKRRTLTANLHRSHRPRCVGLSDRRALIRDLKQRGILDDTLVIWTGEFGRTPDNNKRGGVYSLGRGHNNLAMTMLLAGGGVKPGVVGATDDLGSSAVECVHPIRDLHVTLLHLLGLDDNKLTYFHGGRFKQFASEADQEALSLGIEGWPVGLIHRAAPSGSPGYIGRRRLW